MPRASKTRASRPTPKAAIHESEASFRTFAETTASLIFIIQGRRIKYANPAMEALTGYSREELSRKPYLSSWECPVESHHVQIQVWN